MSVEIGSKWKNKVSGEVVEIKDAIEMLYEYHRGRHYLDESVRSVISSLYSLEAQIKAKDEEIEMLQRRLYHAYCYIKDRYEPKEQ